MYSMHLYCLHCSCMHLYSASSISAQRRPQLWRHAIKHRDLSFRLELNKEVRSEAQPMQADYVCLSVDPCTRALNDRRG